MVTNEKDKSGPLLLHLVVFADAALQDQEVPGLLQLLDGFSVSSSQLSDGALRVLQLRQEA